MLHKDQVLKLYSLIQDIKENAVARKDYQDRRRRQKEGIAKAKIGCLYRGRQENAELHQKIQLLLSENKSYNMIMSLIGCSRGTIAKVAKNMKTDAA